MQYRSTNPEGKARGMSISILHTKQEVIIFTTKSCFLGNKQGLYVIFYFPWGKAFGMRIFYFPGWCQSTD